MAGWEDELAVLLNRLGVKQEEPRPQIQQAPTSKPLCSDTLQHEQVADALYWEDDDEAIEDDDAWIDDLDSMRHEVSAIVSQVVSLLQRGNLSATTREDIMVVLRALHRRIPTENAEADEAYLESASAMLHFCRLVLQLGDFSAEDS